MNEYTSCKNDITEILLYVTLLKRRHTAASYLV